MRESFYLYTDAPSPRATNVILCMCGREESHSRGAAGSNRKIKVAPAHGVVVKLMYVTWGCCGDGENKGNYGVERPLGKRWKTPSHTRGSLFLCNESNSGILLLLLFVSALACGHPGFWSCWPNFEKPAAANSISRLLTVSQAGTTFFLCVFLPVDTMRECVISLVAAGCDQSVAKQRVSSPAGSTIFCVWCE